MGGYIFQVKIYDSLPTSIAFDFVAPVFVVSNGGMWELYLLNCCKLGRIILFDIDTGFSISVCK